jgi:hypothetical protein
MYTVFENDKPAQYPDSETARSKYFKNCSFFEIESAIQYARDWTGYSISYDWDGSPINLGGYTISIIKD